MGDERIVLARSDERIGVYIDGILEMEMRHSSADDRWVDDDWMADEGSFPEKIEDITWRNS